MPLSVRIARGSSSEGPGLVRVYISGTLESATAPTLEQELVPVLEGDIRALVLDLEQLTFLSSAGIRVIVATRKKLAERKATLLMTNLQPQVAKVFEIIKALPDMQVFKDVRELDQYLAGMQRKVVEGE
jgi:anti-anti-sigma factor